MIRTITTALGYLHALADAEARKQTKRQANFKAEEYAKAEQFRKQLAIAEAHADALRVKIATANAKGALGCYLINTAERNAVALRNRLQQFAKDSK